MSFTGFSKSGQFKTELYDGSGVRTHVSTVAGGHGFSSGSYRRASMAHHGVWPHGPGYTELCRFDSPAQCVGVALHPDNQSFYVGRQYDGAASRLWRVDLHTGAIIGEFNHTTQTGLDFALEGTVVVSREHGRVYAQGRNRTTGTLVNRIVAHDLDLTTEVATAYLQDNFSSYQWLAITQTGWLLAVDNDGLYRLPADFTTGATPERFSTSFAHPGAEIFYDGRWVWTCNYLATPQPIEAFDPEDLTTVQSRVTAPSGSFYLQQFFFDGTWMWAREPNAPSYLYRWLARGWDGDAEVIDLPSYFSSGLWAGWNLVNIWWDGHFIRVGMYQGTIGLSATWAIGTLDLHTATPMGPPVEFPRLTNFESLGCDKLFPLGDGLFAARQYADSFDPGHYYTVIASTQKRGEHLVANRFTSLTGASADGTAPAYPYAYGRLPFEVYELDVSALASPINLRNYVPNDRQTVRLTGSLASAKTLVLSANYDLFGVYYVNDCTNAGGSLTFDDQANGGASVAFPFGATAQHVPGKILVL